MIDSILAERQVILAFLPAGDHGVGLTPREIAEKIDCWSWKWTSTEASIRSRLIELQSDGIIIRDGNPIEGFRYRRPLPVLPVVGDYHPTYTEGWTRLLPKWGTRERKRKARERAA